MKHCYVCKFDKDSSLFYNNKNKLDGKCDECIDCRKKLRNKNNIPKWIGKTIEYLTVVAYNKQTKKYTCDCKCGNRVEVCVANLNNNKTKSCGCYVRKELQNSLENSVFSRYKTSAKKIKIEFSLSYSDFKSISENSCYYCGDKNSIKIMHKKYSQFTYNCNGIDRLDNNKGYTLENSVPCCSWCNSMKNTYSVSEFFKKISKISAHFKINGDV
jgi:hypothetical protein